MLQPALYVGPYPYALDSLKKSYVVHVRNDDDKLAIAPSPSEIFYQHSDLSAPLANCKNKVFEM